MTESTTVRDAELRDLARITEIYNGYVRGSHATFDVEEFTVEQRAEWFGHYATDGPHRLIVAELDGTIAGYACSSPFRPKPAYRTTVETSVYLDTAAHGRGIGNALYVELFSLLAATDVHRAIAGIALPNEASVGLHHKHGFTESGTLREVGLKFGRYIDVQYFERPC